MTKYKYIIKTKNAMVAYKGIQERTPTTIIITEKEKVFFESYLKSLAITDFTVCEIKPKAVMPVYNTGKTKVRMKPKDSPIVDSDKD